jgi:hypothetical protein
LPPIDYGEGAGETLEEYTMKVEYNTLKDAREHSVLGIPLIAPDNRTVR